MKIPKIYITHTLDDKYQIMEKGIPVTAKLTLKRCKEIFNNYTLDQLMIWDSKNQTFINE